MSAEKRWEQLPVNGEWTEDDWAQVFPSGSMGDQHYASGDYEGTFSADEYAKRVPDVTPEQIAEVTHFYGVSPEGGGSTDMVCLARLTDGRWATCAAWSDYTGWGCQANARWRVSATREGAISGGLDRDERRRFGLLLDDES